jgi:phage terminase small subunit
MTNRKLHTPGFSPEIEASITPGLTPKQILFVDEYLLDLNASAAAARAGYSKTNTYKQGSRLLAHKGVAEAVRRSMEERSTRTQISQDRVLQEIARLAFSNMLDYVEPGEDGLVAVEPTRLDRGQAAALTEISVEKFASGSDKRVRIKLADKKGYLELLARHLGIFSEKIGIENIDLAIAIVEARKRAGINNPEARKLAGVENLEASQRTDINNSNTRERTGRKGEEGGHDA